MKSKDYYKMLYLKDIDCTCYNNPLVSSLTHYRSFVCWFNYYLLKSINQSFQVANSKPFLKFIKLSFDTYINGSVIYLFAYVF